MLREDARVYIVSSARPKLKRHGGRVRVLRDADAVRKAVAAAPASAWLLEKASSVPVLAAETASRRIPRSKAGRLILLDRPANVEGLAAVSDLFASAYWADAACRWLSLSQIVEAVFDARAADLVIGGTVDRDAQLLTLYRGDLSRLTVPLSAFAPTGDGTAPDFADFAPADDGLAVRFGRYEASVGSVLYEFDPSYRKRYRKNLTARLKTFGASLRRLRLLKGLRQEDFGPVTSRTVARLEADETERPHGRTLERLAACLGVGPDEIETY